MPKGLYLDKPEHMQQKLDEAADILRRKNIELNEANRRNRELQERLDVADDIRQLHYGLGQYNPTPPTWISGKSGGIGSRGCPITMWSDGHHGEVVKPQGVTNCNEFNKDIARQRYYRLFDTVVDVCYNHMGRANKEYPGIIVCLGGDMVGGDIHEELARTNDLPPLKASHEMADILCAGLELMASKFGKVYVPCVVGNHGRTTKKPPFKDIVDFNYDGSLYKNIEKYFRKDKKFIHIDAPESADLHFKSYGVKYMMTHGDHLGTGGGDGIIGAIGPIMRGSIKLGQQTHKMGIDFDELLMGHFHRLMWLPGVTVNNSLKGFDEYAALKLRVPPTRPSQALWFNHPEHGTTARWEIFLEGRKPAETQQERVWASWTEDLYSPPHPL
jgi:hypothetical protein